MELAQIWTDRGMLNFLSTFFGQIKTKNKKKAHTHTQKMKKEGQKMQNKH